MTQASPPLGGSSPGRATAASFDAVLRALEACAARPSGLKLAAFAYGTPDGELRDEVWGMCPACGLTGLRVSRLAGGRAAVSCGNGGCKRDAIVEALARALVERAGTAA